ncbi:hypothetical protein NC652_027519 [Populus alba x Populus x berolinensis]|nr:hypothetical protein NC652_027519 [Populus alba x Populus x berolinensis]
MEDEGIITKFAVADLFPEMWSLTNSFLDHPMRSGPKICKTRTNNIWRVNLGPSAIVADRAGWEEMEEALRARLGGPSPELVGLHGYRAGRKWRRIPRAFPARKIPGNFLKINQPA